VDLSHALIKGGIYERFKEIRNYEDLIKNANVIIVQMEIPIDTISEIFAIGSEGRGTKILNPAPLKPIPSEILQNVDIIVPNEGELFRLHSFLGCLKITDSSDNKILLASKDISKFGVKNVITTLGKKGCHVFQSSGEQSTLIPAFPVEAVDTVGAGDCFNGVLASKLNQGHELIESVLYASAAASIAVTRKGAQDSMPYEDEIIKRYSELRKLINNEET